MTKKKTKDCTKQSVRDTPSPECNTMLDLRLEAHKSKTARIATFTAGTLNVSNMFCSVSSW